MAAYALTRCLPECLLCCLPGGSKGTLERESSLQPLNSLPSRSLPSLEDLIEESTAARLRTWEQLGAVEARLVTTPPASSAHLGPKWPASQQAFRVIRRPAGTVLIASDGLSDPFDDLTLGEGNVNGYGLELYIETPAAELAHPLQDVRQSWQFQLLNTVCQLAAGHGGLRAILDDLRLLSTEAEGLAAALPPAAASTVVNPAGRVGALLGLRSRPQAGASLGGAVPPSFSGLPLTDALLVNVKLLLLGELDLIAKRGAEGRRMLDALFSGPDRLVSSLARPSVLAPAEPRNDDAPSQDAAAADSKLGPAAAAEQVKLREPGPRQEDAPAAG